MHMTDTCTAPEPDIRTCVERTDAAISRLVVVAVDGSEASIAALRWARSCLIEPGDAVKVLTAYQYAQYASEVPITNGDLHGFADGARAAAHDAIVHTFGPVEPGLEVEHIVKLGCIEGLVEAHSAHAAFVVVGTRPRRRFRDRLRPSATNRITGRSLCPVISIPHVPDVDGIG